MRIKEIPDPERHHLNALAHEVAQSELAEDEAWKRYRSAGWTAGADLNTLYVRWDATRERHKKAVKKYKSAYEQAERRAQIEATG